MSNPNSPVTPPKSHSELFCPLDSDMYDIMFVTSYMRYFMAHSKALTVRIPEARLRKLMRARKAKTQSDLINTLLAEEEERLRSHQVLRDTAGTLKPSEINDRLL